MPHSIDVRTGKRTMILKFHKPSPCPACAGRISLKEIPADIAPKRFRYLRFTCSRCHRHVNVLHLRGGLNDMWKATAIRLWNTACNGGPTHSHILDYFTGGNR
ncbi:hypothetical protein [Bifidobacterium scaligerum]|uniref:Uncharacterized protein n=1 Tax=Bifidobacterium scaligerum TaxID=2052656 RepID=A0A2M9HT53_9BIFI|nr:hypothetical protein [Bifidobacterium scaligerum]PJM79987.1 hypothetical protein CUU80_02305 [Bifidobacterium scaligerum]